MTLIVFSEFKLRVNALKRFVTVLYLKILLSFHFSHRQQVQGTTRASEDLCSGAEGGAQNWNSNSPVQKDRNGASRGIEGFFPCTFFG